MLNDEISTMTSDQISDMQNAESCFRKRKFHPLFCFGHLMLTQTDLIFWTARKHCNFSEMWRVHTTRYSVIFPKISSRVWVEQKNLSSIRVAGTRWTLPMVGWLKNHRKTIGPNGWAGTIPSMAIVTLKTIANTEADAQDAGGSLIWAHPGASDLRGLWPLGKPRQW